ncbi:glycosyltransferase family 2 protein, partial [bacterium]
MAKLSVVVLTKNEEACIADCLTSVKWAPEIIVVDDESTDKTVEIVKQYTDRIFFRKMDIEGKHRNWAYAQARNPWVLSLDADETVTPELKIEIEKA